jgi:hypothetical protein
MIKDVVARDITEMAIRLCPFLGHSYRKSASVAAAPTAIVNIPRQIVSTRGLFEHALL